MAADCYKGFADSFRVREEGEVYFDPRVALPYVWGMWESWAEVFPEFGHAVRVGEEFSVVFEVCK